MIDLTKKFKVFLILAPGLAVLMALPTGAYAENVQNFRKKTLEHRITQIKTAKCPLVSKTILDQSTLHRKGTFVPNSDMEVLCGCGL